MSQPFIGEVRMAGFNFAPQGWEFCEGQLLPITEFDALFNLIGTTYGGDGMTTFALPDLRGRVPIHQGNGGGGEYVMGQAAGAETVTLGVNQIPAHNHLLNAQSGVGTQPGPSNGVWAASSLNQFSGGPGTGQMAATSIANAGGGQSHDNMPPFLVINFIISLYGIFPTQN